MKVTSAGDKYLNVVSAALLLFTFTLFIASFSSSNWATSPPNSTLGLSFGLWTTCFYDSKMSDRRCMNTDDYIIDAWRDGWIPGTQAMMTLALLGLVGAMAALATGFIPQLEDHPAPIFISLCSTFSFVAWGWAGVIIFICRWSYDENLQNTDLSWCTILGVLALVLAMGALASLFVRVISLQQTAHIQKKSTKRQQRAIPQPNMNTNHRPNNPQQNNEVRGQEDLYEDLDIPRNRNPLPPINHSTNHRPKNPHQTNEVRGQEDLYEDLDIPPNRNPLPPINHSAVASMFTVSTKRP